MLNLHLSSICRELKRGQVEHFRSDLSKYKTYAADRAINKVVNRRNSCAAVFFSI